MVDQAMDLWVVSGLGFTPVSPSETIYMDPDLAAQASGFPAGGGLSFYGDQGMPEGNWYTEASYPVGTQSYPLGAVSTSLAPTQAMPLTLGLSSAAQPSGISWTKITWQQVAAVLAVLAVLYVLYKRHHSKGAVAAQVAK